MAKKKVSGPGTENAAAGAAAARQPRRRTVKSVSTASPSPQANGAASAVEAATADAVSAAAPAPPETAATESRYMPSFDEIARVAYSYWVARGCQGGSAEDDWLRAERELRTRRSLEANA